MIQAPQRTAPSPRLTRLRPGHIISAFRARAVGQPRYRAWLLACCVALAALAFGSHPGQIIADTKIDLAVNPAAFLERALHLWDPAQFGQLQDQAVGYFFPIGPFFLVGHLLAVPGWVTQRLWITFLLAAAFLGTTRLSSRLGIGTPASRIVAGFSYALAPSALGLLGTLSSEFLPIAMLPWILIPLVRAVQAGPDPGTGSQVQAAAQSAVAVAMCSGINAAATAAVLVPAIAYLVFAPRRARRWRLTAWWAAAVLLATSWWLYPLLLLQRYGVSILPYTESAATTTSVTSLSNALRGTENWISYLMVDGQPWWPVAYRIATGALPTIVTGLIAGLGLTGLLARRMPHRRFLLAMLLAGVCIILTGYVSSLGNPLAGALDHIINGPLAPLRNLRKFDPLIRLPVALGLASLLPSVRPGLPRRAAAIAAAGAICLLAAPVYVSGLSTPGSFTSVPAYWSSAASWLNRHAGQQGVLEEPGARFGQYTWGSPMDDILEPLFTGDWASSQLSAIGSVGNTRLLQAIDDQMAAGDGSAGLTQLLARMGVRYLVVRNDLLRADLRGAWPARIHQAIAESPGLVKVAQFGSAPVGDQSPGDAISSFDAPYPPVEIYQVAGAQPVAVVQPVSATMRVYGAPEALLTLADDHLLDNRPVLLNSDDPQIRAASTVVTDSLRRRVRNFGEIRDDYSPTLTATAPLRTFEATADYTEPGWRPYLAVAAYRGIAGVTASSAASDIAAIPSQSGTGLLPYAAIDGNMRTMWESGSLGGPVGQWIKIDFLRPVDAGTIGVAFADNTAIGPPVTRVEVTTATGQVAEPVRVTGSMQAIQVPPGPSGWLTITITGVLGGSGDELGRQVGIAEISIPGVSASRTIEAPDVRLPGGADPSAVVLAKAEPQPSGCMLTSQRWVCNPALEKSTEEQYGFDESFTAARPSAASLSGTAVLTSPSLIEKYAYAGRQQPVVTASSSYTSDPEDLASSAFDGNPLTTWISGAGDAHPTLTIRWRQRRQVRAVTILRPAGVVGPLRVRITGSAGQVRTGVLDAPGQLLSSTISFAPMQTTSLALTFPAGQEPVQITDVTIPGVRRLSADAAARVTLACGRGPEITVDGKQVPTRVSGTVADVLQGRPMAFSACAPVRMAAGLNSVVEPDADAFSVQSVALDRAAPRLLSAAPPVRNEPARVLRWTAGSRVLRVAATTQSYLIVNENFNAGWQAVLGGRVLQPVRLDGWKQGWLLPAGSAGLVTLTYQPDTPYRAALFGGLIALAAIMAVAFVPLRRRRKVPAMPASAGTASAGTASAGTASAMPASAMPASAGTASAMPASAHGNLKARLTGRAALVGAVVLGALAGLWLGGYPGVVLLPLVTAGFLLTTARAARSRACAILAGPWLAAALLVIASASGALGEHLARNGNGAGISSALTGAIPQLLCLGIVGRVIAGLLLAAARDRDHDDISL